jgi:hemin uptake protein HemP
VTIHAAAGSGSTPRTDAAAVPSARRAVSSAALFAENREIIILHAGEEYRLRITKAGKLILTK